jgi:hypothetical protein
MPRPGNAQHRRDEDDDVEWIEFELDDAPSVLTTPNLCTIFGGCDHCPGWATVAATGLAPDHPNQDEIVFCTHECHELR